MRFYTPIVVGTTAALLVSCAYIIPPAENAPRNNEVRGDMHRPQLNGAYAVRPQSAVATPIPMQTTQPVAQQAPTPATAEAVAVAELPPVTAAAPTTATRRVPLENQSFQTAAMGFDPITQVPPRPAMTGPESIREQLQATQSDMEQTRTQAFEARDTLARDAAAEPSMLSPLPKASVAPSPRRLDAPAAVVAPTQPKPTSAITPQVGVPIAAVLPDEPMILPSPPEPLGAMPVAAMRVPAENPTSLPAIAGDFDPLTVAERAPVAVAATPLPAPKVTTYPTAIKGDFDPLAAADNQPVTASPIVATAPAAAPGSHYASSGMIAPSRYATRRF